ncbi:ABC transporter ATP-binding protein [bacterium]|nr:ABC transporter ATP-binding protein [bacterium]
MVSVSGLSHRFDTKWVLRDIEFEVAAGEIAVIMGSSGGGKTTLLKCISGLLRPTEGEILVDGVSVVRDPDHALAKLGLVFQYAALFDSLTVEDNVLFGLRRARKVAQSEEKEILGRLLEQVGLEDVESKLPSELSGGMRKRVGLARALCMEPQVLLYDEPTSGLDPVTAYSIDRLIVETRDRLGLTSLVVSHDVSSIFRVADRIIFLHQGEILFNGSPVDFRAVQDGPIGELIGKARSESLELADL